ncbi:MAG TPA: pirin family protein [Kiloniellaceae bacterium]|nr:pirin family protein [Kiloniellaceae bacterium]
MQYVRPSTARGQADLGWLNSKHSFSFGQYFDPQFMGFGPLRVINEDRIAPGTGFDTHGHRDMEIVTYVLEGTLAHKDSLGHGAELRPGEVQHMTAGTGIRHSEFNPSDSEALWLLQIWIQPEREGLTPGYDQKVFPTAGSKGRLQLLASRDGRDGALTIRRDVDLYALRLEGSQHLTHDMAPGRLGWVQVARGRLQVNGRVLSAGDGSALEGERAVTFSDGAGAELLFFDMAP